MTTSQHALDYQQDPLMVKVHERLQTADEGRRQSVLDAITRSLSLAGVMRICGALTVIASMSVFLLQGWTLGNDINRYYLLMAQSLLLAGGGFSLSYLLKENKGARVFFGLGLLSVTANMITLGALIYSVIQWGGGLGHYPAFATWRAPTAGSLAMAGVLGLVALVPLASFSLHVLARRSAKMLSVLFLFANLLTLIPVRASEWAGLVAMIGIIVPLWGMRKLLAEDATLRTPEGLFAIANLFIPAAIVIIRSVCFYQVDLLMHIMLAITGFIFVRVIAKSLGRESVWQLPLGYAAIAFTALAWSPVSELLSALPSQISSTVFSVTAGLVGMDVAMRGRRFQTHFLNVTVIAVTCSQLSQLLTANDAISTVLFIVAGLAVAAIGRIHTRRDILMVGVSMTVLGIADLAYMVIHHIHLSQWQALAGFGVAIIVAASVIERHGAVIQLKCRQWMKL